MNEAPLLERVRVVLSHPSHPGNIGAAARAMKTMGLSALYLVNPRLHPDPLAEAMASGGLDVLRSARVCGSLDEALEGTVLAVALTARRRGISHPVHDAREAAGVLVRHAVQGEVALVFGTEMSGLSNEEVLKCQRIAQIPANPDYPSLNLAAAVQVMAYELRVAAGTRALPEAKRFPLAQHQELEALYRHLGDTLLAIGFIDPKHPRRMMPRLRRLFDRAQLEREEVNILRGILKAVNRIAGREDPRKPHSNS